jgi:hypothetical protein
VTVVDAHDYGSARDKLNEILKPNDFRRAVLTVSDGSQIYITTHMFFEDLAVINENLYQTSSNLPGVYQEVVEESKDQLSFLKFGDGESSSSNSDLGSPAAVIQK